MNAVISHSPMVPQPGRGGWERRLRKDLDRVLPYVELALGVIVERWMGMLPADSDYTLCEACGRPQAHVAHQPFGECPAAPPGALRAELEGCQAAFREALAHGPGMVHRPPDDPHAVVEAQHARLLSVLAEEGLDVALACSKLGLPRRVIEQRMRDDAYFAEQVQCALDRGTIAIYETVHKAARGQAFAGGQHLAKVAIHAAERLLEQRDPTRFAKVQRVEIREEDIRRSKAWPTLVARVLEAIAPGHECTMCGGCHCKERMEAVRDG